MELILKGTPEEIKNVLQAIKGSEEHTKPSTKSLHYEMAKNISVDKESAKKLLNFFHQNLEMTVKRF